MLDYFTEVCLRKNKALFSILVSTNVIHLTSDFIIPHDPTDKLLNHTCLMCGKEDIWVINRNPRANLKVHWAGNLQFKNGLYLYPSQAWAIASAIKITPPFSGGQTISKAKNQNKCTLFGIEQSKCRYDVSLINKLLCLWLVQQALPPKQIKDPDLRTTFDYAWPGVRVYNRKWMSKAAKQFYLSCRDSVRTELQVCQSLYFEIFD